MEKEIIWSKTALKQLESIYFYLLEKSKSEEISDKVVDTIYNATTILKTNCEIYEIDELKVSNDGNYRAFEKYNYRISYKVTKSSIYILRVRHTSRNPKEF